MGNLQGVRSPVPAPAGINYLLVTLKPGERWVYLPPVGHTVGWVAVAKGALDSGALISSGEMAVLEPGEKPVALESAGQEDAVFVLGSAIPHPFALHLGSYSVHTSVAALEAGERRIEELYRKLSARAPERHRARA